MLHNLSDGWHLGGAAIAYVLRDRPLKRFLAGSIGAVVVIAAVVAALAVALRRHAGPVEYALGSRPRTA
jgi:Co/Zn/Cd efflux system component